MEASKELVTKALEEIQKDEVLGAGEEAGTRRAVVFYLDRGKSGMSPLSNVTYWWSEESSSYCGGFEPGVLRACTSQRRLLIL